MDVEQGGQRPLDAARPIHQHRNLGCAGWPRHTAFLDRDIGIGKAGARAQHELVDHLAAAGQVGGKIEYRHLFDKRQQFRIDRRTCLHRLLSAVYSARLLVSRIFCGLRLRRTISGQRLSSLPGRRLPVAFYLAMKPS